ncbi:thermostable hemolysin [Litoreibacter janthinus]|uniref:Thermostable hemolysin n=1 Tax=Litoreibacter janthinus TaxID=670154 RepID=A0A1I6H2I1_9RHOB|nr:thermostable hemolysin [Litoreibacter janthinus]SFR48676.1 Thermostable hemolysin [Litoreibacter janthinus]
MQIEFLEAKDPGYVRVQSHIREVYGTVYGAVVSDFAPLLVSAKRPDGQILCAAGIRTAKDGFFSDRYLQTDLSTALLTTVGLETPEAQIMEVVSLASLTPFPVLPLLDTMIRWGRLHGMTCGVFTATKPLRRLLKRTGLSYIELAEAEASKLENSDTWGSYYETDPRVCAFSEMLCSPVTLSPRERAVSLQFEAS